MFSQNYDTFLRCDDFEKLANAILEPPKRFIREERRKKRKIEQQAKADANRAWKDKVKHITLELVEAEKKQG